MIILVILLTKIFWTSLLGAIANALSAEVCRPEHNIRQTTIQRNIVLHKCPQENNKYYYLIVKFYMFYKVFFIFNYLRGFDFLVFYCLVIYCLVFYCLAFYCLVIFDLYCDWLKQSHEYLLLIRNLV